MKELYKKQKIISNKIMCRRCGEMIESKTVHDFKTCKCGACAVDGGHNYLRRCFTNKDDIIEMSEVILVDGNDDENK